MDSFVNGNFPPKGGQLRLKKCFAASVSSELNVNSVKISSIGRRKPAHFMVFKEYSLGKSGHLLRLIKNLVIVSIKTAAGWAL